MVIFNIVITVHKYEESNVNFNIVLNGCQLDNCVISLARPFRTCTYRHVIYYIPVELF